MQLRKDTTKVMLTTKTVLGSQVEQFLSKVKFDKDSISQNQQRQRKCTSYQRNNIETRHCGALQIAFRFLLHHNHISLLSLHSSSRRLILKNAAPELLCGYYSVIRILSLFGEIWILLFLMFCKIFNLYDSLVSISNKLIFSIILIFV